MASFPDGQEPLALTDFQVQVAQLFFSLPQAAGFLPAGGAGLVAQHLTTRPTQDLDFFTRVVRVQSGEQMSRSEALRL